MNSKNSNSKHVVLKTKKTKKPYVYIVQSSLEPAKCKIGITDNLSRRLKEYNSTTGQSKDNIYSYLFTCEVKDAVKLEKDIKTNFAQLREQASCEIYFYNKPLFDQYIGFIRSHELFVREFLVREEKTKVVKIVKRTAPTLKERGMTPKAVMQRAQRVKNDEFYTRYEDVEKEMSMYPLKTWENKCVFCNCDDAVGSSRTEKDSSAFALYFINNFFKLKLKKLICTHYCGKTDLFNAGSKGYVFTKDGMKEICNKDKNYTGSFEDPVSLKILKEEADIVCTNPPFSLAKDFWKLVIESGKKFIIISNISNCVTQGFIPFFKQNKVWAGYNRVDSYIDPKGQIVDASGHWFTNIKIEDRPKSSLLKIVPVNQIPEKSKTIDDNGVLSVKDGFIPSDYNKPFAVSVRPILNGVLEKGYSIIKIYTPYVNEKRKFTMTLIQKDG